MEFRVSKALLPIVCILLVILSHALPISATRHGRNMLANGLRATPPMGWNSWNNFFCNIDEEMVRATADAMVLTGLANLGYKYINIDNCWAEKERDAKGNLVPKKSTFPLGIKALADYVHSKGLKLGIYTDAGTYTCSGTMPGALGYEEQDAKTFAEWLPCDDQSSKECWLTYLLLTM